MSDLSWVRIDQLFEAAVTLPADRRGSFLDEACASDPLLRREIDSLLRSHEGAESAIGRLVGEAASSVSMTAAPGMVGRRVGAYRLVAAIGHGGMGDVYLAERADDSFEKRVAIKFMRGGMETEAMLDRFRHERRILASLDHPNIARLLDGGVTDDGLPYFVMEYVDGRPLVEYCDAHRLATTARLKLFRTVCDAVTHAHQHLVVHRDLKPGNILVTPEGVPKLLDFGIAKPLDPTVTRNMTGTLAAMLTPDYASPEQVRGGPITTATDVFSLGAVLYELLSGRKPRRFTTYLPAEIERVICDVDTERPSAASANADGSAGCDVDEDLDNIVLMAMRKEPHRRYASAEQLAQDIQRYLDRRPIHARPDTFGYRCRKFTLRNRVGLAVAAGFLIVAAGFLTSTLLQARRITLERNKAQQVASFMVDLFKVADPSEARGNSVTAREILDRGAIKARDELGTQPEIQASMLHTIGEVYQSLGLYEAALPLLKSALEVRRRIYGPEAPEVADTLDELATVHFSRAENDAAEPLFREALRMRRSHGARNEKVALSVNNLGALLAQKGDSSGSLALFREALEIRRAVLGNSHPDVGESLSNIAFVLPLDQFDTKMKTYEEAVGIYRARFGDTHPDVAQILNNMGVLLNYKGRNAEAERYEREAVAIRKRVLGDQHPLYAESLNNLANVLRDQQKLTEAEPLFRESLAIRRKRYGETHPAVLRAINNLVLVLTKTGQTTEAEVLLRGIIDTRPAEARNAGAVTTAQRELGDILMRRGDARGAEPLLRASLAAYRKTPALEPWRVPNQSRVLGECLLALDRPREAQPLLQEAYDGLKSTLGEADEKTAAAARALALASARANPVTGKR